jgi:hypothetical protein
MQSRILNLKYGIYYATHLENVEEWSQKDAFMDKNVSTQEAMKYLKISNPTHLRYNGFENIKAVKTGTYHRPLSEKNE